MRKLSSMVGEMIVARIPVLHKTDLVLVRLHAVEPTGIWVEHQGYTNHMMKHFGMHSSCSTLILFVPFQSIEFILGSLESLSLSEQAFGLTDGS